MIVTAITFTVYTIDRVYRESEAHRVNTVRTYTSSVMNQVRDVFPNVDEMMLEAQLEYLNVTAIITDIDGNILFNNT